MRKNVYLFSAAALALLAVFLIFYPGSTTGALGVSNAHPTFITFILSGIVIFLLSPLALFRNFPKEKELYSFDDILEDNISKRKKKGLRYFGKLLFRSGHGADLGKSVKNDDFYYELGKVNLMLKNLGNFDTEGREKFFRMYNVHEFHSKGLGDRDIIAVDARELNDALNSHGRGNFRYIFEKGSRRYLGVARHTKNGDYRWV